MLGLKKTTRIVAPFFTVLTLSLFSLASTPSRSLTPWLQKERAIAVTRMFANISPKGAAQGAVAAGPSRQNPDYYYHWIRDSAITMNEIAFRLERGETPAERVKESQMMQDYANFSRSNQKSKALTGLGEPKFNMDGSPFSGSWARPQNDGPALRAITLIHWARVLMRAGEKQKVLNLYNPKSPAQSLIGADLDYIVANWKKPCYDLWEETFGQHFFTRMAQRKALLEGADLAKSLGDLSRARIYRAQAQALESEINKHWDSKKKIILPTLDQTNMNYKKSGLDSSVVLGILLGQTGDGFFVPEDGRVLATVKALEDSFKALYSVNRSSTAPGIAIGRYPEDRYNGTDVFNPNNGNPWVLNTEAFSQFYSLLIEDYGENGKIMVTQDSLPFFEGLSLGEKAHLKAGEVISSGAPLFKKIMAALAENRDRFMDVVRRYAHQDGTLSEQINRKTGAMTSAPNLTWNYAQFLAQDRARVLK